MKKKIFKVLISLFLLFSLVNCLVLYASAEGDEIPEGNVYYFEDTTYNAGHNDAYSENHKIDEDDIHYGWSLGEFYLTGYTRQTTDENGNLVFLKTFGDDITLWYKLKQDINKLDGDKKLKINEDKKAKDEHFGINKTNFGKGMLIIQQTDYQNKVHEAIKYPDFLKAKEVDAATEVHFFEEGDYEIALDYAIDNGHIIGLNKDYRWTFKFSVRNGNCMVFPKDVVTDAELNNTSITPNGFYLDLARSKYLDINITKEIMNEGANGLVEDVRFNRPAKDGDKYTDEGIYTIKVYNKYTEETTIKKIYVGDDLLLKAHMNTGFSVDLIKSKLDEGWTINTAGKLVSPTPTPTPLPTETPTPTPSPKPDSTKTPTKIADNGSAVVTPGVILDPSTSNSENVDSITREAAGENKSNNGLLIIIIVILCILVIGLGIFAAIMYRKSKEQNVEMKRNDDGKGINEDNYK